MRSATSQGLLGRDAVYCCGRVPTFQRSLHPEPGGSTDLWNVGILGILPHYTASQPRGPRLVAERIFFILKMEPAWTSETLVS